MKSARENMDVIAAYQQVGTYRGAAVMCGTTHKTVKRIIERAESGGKPPVRRSRGRNFQVVAGLVAERVAAAKKEWRRGHHRGRRPAVWTPGETLAIDWGSVGDLHVFCAVLCWSRV